MRFPGATVPCGGSDWPDLPPALTPRGPRQIRQAGGTVGPASLEAGPTKEDGSRNSHPSRIVRMV